MKRPFVSVDASPSRSFLPMQRLQLAVLLLVVLSISLPRVAVVHSFAVVAPPSTRPLRQQRHDEESIVSLALFPLFSSLASDSSTANTDTSRLLERSSLDDHHYEEEEHTDYTNHNDVLQPKLNSMPAGVQPHIQVIESHVELQEFLAQDDRLCMIKFHAAWCKSCKRFGLHFNKLVAQKGDWMHHTSHDIVHHGNVRVASIEWTACTALCRSMGITRLPTVQFFASGQKVGSIVAGPTKFVQVQQALDHYLSLQSSELEFEADMERGKTLMESESARIFNKNSPLSPKATTTSNTSSNQPGVLSSSEKVAAAAQALVTEANNNNDNNTSPARDGDDQSQRRRTSWWNIKGVWAQRRARRDAARP